MRQKASFPREKNLPSYLLEKWDPKIICNSGVPTLKESIIMLQTKVSRVDASTLQGIHASLGLELDASFVGR